jgi:hypothetical protein
MNLIRTRLTSRLAALTTTVLLAASTASAMQTTPPAKPIAPERMAQLSEMRRQIADLWHQVQVHEDDASRSAAREAADKLEAEMSKQPENTHVLDQVTLDASFFLLALYGREGVSEFVIPNLVSTFTRSLEARNASVEVTFDETLGALILEGPRWQVDDAKVLAGELNAAVVQRIQDLRAADLEQRRAVRLGDERDEEASRKAAQEALRAKTVNIAWNGGNLGELIAAVKKQVACNVVLSDPSLGEVSIPPLSVQFMAPKVFFLMLEKLPRTDGNDFDVTVVSQSTVEPGANSPVPDDGSMSAITISPSSRTGNPPESRIFDLRALATADDQKPVIDAISFAMDAANYTSRVKVRFHEPSKLLFVQGPGEAIVLVYEILSALELQ